MELTRATLEADHTRHSLRDSVLASRLLTDLQLESSRQSMIRQWDPSQPFWVFGYGSLIWNPQLRVAQSIPTTVRGYHRALCLWSKINRGTPETPGLVLGLKRGGACCGVAFQIEHEHVEAESILLWRREMLMGSYVPIWAFAQTESGEKIRVLTFKVDTGGAGYACGIDDDEIARVVKSARGHYGACLDYVRNTVESLAAHGIHDAQLEALIARLNASPSAGSTT